MNGEHISDERLQDDALDEIGEAHLAGCERCRKEREAYRKLRADLRAMPASVEPERDLLPEILRRVPVPVPVGIPARVPIRIRFRSQLRLAAALALAILGAALLHRPSQPKAPAPIEAAYAKEVGELVEALNARKGVLRPETIQTIETNLRIIDDAIARARSALEEDPASTELSELFSFAYETKVELLRRASEIPDMRTGDKP